MKKFLAPVLFMSTALSLQASFHSPNPNMNYNQESQSNYYAPGNSDHNSYPPHLHMQDSYYQPQQDTTGYYTHDQADDNFTSETLSAPQNQSLRGQQNLLQDRMATNDSFATDEDRNLGRRIRDFLRGQQNIMIKINNGNVTLRGTVNSADDIDRIEMNVKKMPGVRSLNNQITLRDNRSSALSTPSLYISAGEQSSQTLQQPNDSFQTEEDRILGRRIRDQLRNSDLAKHLNAIVIRINNGNVTLIGLVDTEDDRTNIEENVGTLPGVRTLTNQIKVRESQGSYLNSQRPNISVAETNTKMEGKVDSFQTDEDRALGAKIREFLRSGELSKRHDTLITIRINNGNVTLRGTIVTPEDKAKIESIIKKLQGVRSLDDQATVQDNKSSSLNTSRALVAQSNQMRTQMTLTKDEHGDSFLTPQDRELMTKIREALKGGWFSKGYDEIAIVVDHGDVSLHGKVDNQNDITKIEDRVKKVEGVKNLDLQISLKKNTK